MKNKVLKTIAYIVGFMWVFSACAIDSEGSVGTAMWITNAVCGSYLALFSYANNWWEGYEDKPHGKSKRKGRKTYRNCRTAHSRGERVNRGNKCRVIPTSSALKKKKNSVKRRCIQARQEILIVIEELESQW